MKKVLLIISGSIAAYKSLELIRRLREHGVMVRCILTRGGAEFITPLSVAALSGEAVYTDLFSLKEESEMGHIRLSREADMVVVAPASADIMAKMALGFCDDLATAALLATDKPVLVAPAMNARMWEHPASKRNVAQLIADGVEMIAPPAGALACGETGEGRLAEVETIVSAILSRLNEPDSLSLKPLRGKKALVTSGPTFEPIDPVRYIGNYSSGKQGYAIAESLANAGAEVVLVSGPTALAPLAHVKMVSVQTADEMLAACLNALPADIAVCAAAVADWKAAKCSAQKIKKQTGKVTPQLALTENPDIVYTIATHKKRPALVIGFAAETEQLLTHAKEKLLRKKCDGIVANDISKNIFGADENSVMFVTNKGSETWPRQSKKNIAAKLTDYIVEQFNDTRRQKNHR